MANVIEKIIEWANELPYWEQSALEKIINNIVLKEADYEEILKYFKEDTQLVHMSENRPEISLSELSACTTPFIPLIIEKMYCINNVNALPSGQEIHFHPQLTVIYGNNGSGKTGYARILACSATARGKREIIPNVGVAPNTAKKPKAVFDILDTKGVKHSIGFEYIKDKRCKELSSFYVFDSNSHKAYIDDSHEVELSPIGLDILTRLSDVVDYIKEKIQKEINDKNRNLNLEKQFEGNSCIREMLSKISRETNIDNIILLSKLTPPEMKEKKKLEDRILKIKTLNIPNNIKILQLQKDDLFKLISELDKLLLLVDDKAIEVINTLINNYNNFKSQVSQLSIDNFKSEKFSQIGTETWYAFVDAAKKLSDSENKSGYKYPNKGDICLLCRQTLSEKEVALFRDLWSFIDSETKDYYENANEQCIEKYCEIENIKYDFFGEGSTIRRFLKDKDINIVVNIDEFIVSIKNRVTEMLSMLGKREDVKVTPIKEYKKDSLNEIKKEIENEISMLEKNNYPEILNEIEYELKCYLHRESLATHINEIDSFIEDMRWINKAESISLSTRHISIKYNEIFQEFIAKKLRETFESNLGKFRKELKVSIDTRTQKGQILKKLIIQKHPDITTRPNIEFILSEGEKRAVAISDFLTEVKLDENSKGMIFDDPVTSLDDEWKEKIASILVEEAKNKQIIIFTHDLHFHYLLMKYSSEFDVDQQAHWIRRDEYNDVPGYVYLNNSPSSEKEYRIPKRAIDFCNKAKSATPQEQESLLKSGFGALRTTYEVFIIYELFNEVVLRFEERISFGRLKDIVWDEDIIKQVIKKCEYLSRYIEGHSHSDEYSSKKPDVKTLNDEIEEFNKTKSKLKELKNKKK